MLASGILFLIVQIGQISLTSMVLYKGLELDLSFTEKIKAFIIRFFSAIDLAFLYGIFGPFADLFEILTSFNLDFSAVKVTCPGATAPYEMLVMLGVLGLAFVIIESDVQVFKLITLNALVSALWQDDFRRILYEVVLLRAWNKYKY
jgi:hypothetical protein